MENNPLFTDNLAWALRVARKVWRGLPPSFDLDDLQQVARVEHWRQVQRYDPGRGIPYQAFAYLAVHGAVQMACRRRFYQDNTGEELSGMQIDERLRPDEALLHREHQQKVLDPRKRRQLAKVRMEMLNLPAVDAYLVQRVCMDGEELKALEATWGVQLGQRLGVAIQRLRRALA